MTSATCRNDECPSVGKTITDLPLTWIDEETGQAVTVGSVTCGACGQQITDIVDA